jgi:hypothetical protein
VVSFLDLYCCSGTVKTYNRNSVTWWEKWGQRSARLRKCPVPVLLLVPSSGEETWAAEEGILIVSNHSIEYSPAMNIYKRILTSVAITYLLGIGAWVVVYWGSVGYRPTILQYLVLPFFLAGGMPIVAIITLLLVFCAVSAFALRKRK